MALCDTCSAHLVVYTMRSWPLWMQLIARHADGTLDVLCAQQSGTGSGAGMANTSSQMMSKLNWIEALRRLEVRPFSTDCCTTAESESTSTVGKRYSHCSFRAHSLASSACSLLPIPLWLNALASVHIFHVVATAAHRPNAPFVTVRLPVSLRRGYCGGLCMD